MFFSTKISAGKNINFQIASAIERIQAGTLTAVIKRPDEDEYDKKGTSEVTFDLESSESDTDNEDIILVSVSV